MPRISALPAKTRAAVDDELPIHDPLEAQTKKITVGMIMPAGAIIDYAGAAAPEGWLLCYGQTLNATTSPQYADLYAAIGNTYGGSSITDFKLPDTRGRVVAGQDDMGGASANRLTNPAATVGGIDGDVLGGVGGAETHILTTTQMPAHRHTAGHKNHAAGPGPANPSPDWAGIIHNVGYGKNGLGDHVDNGDVGMPSVGPRGGDAAHNNVQPTIILNKIIKY